MENPLKDLNTGLGKRQTGAFVQIPCRASLLRDFSQERGSCHPSPCAHPKSACFFHSPIQPQSANKFPHGKMIFRKKVCGLFGNRLCQVGKSKRRSEFPTHSASVPTYIFDYLMLIRTVLATLPLTVMTTSTLPRPIKARSKRILN